MVRSGPGLDRLDNLGTAGSRRPVCAQLKFRIWSEGSVVVDLDRKLVAQRASWNAYTPVGFQI